MRGIWIPILTLLAPLALASGFSAALHAQGSGALPASQVPLPPESNPPGDIPDTQVFFEYHSPLGFSLKVPEGWARHAEAAGARFTDKYGAVEIQVTPAAAALSTASGLNLTEGSERGFQAERGRANLGHAPRHHC
jgi:hypothetical protein